MVLSSCLSCLAIFALSFKVICPSAAAALFACFTSRACFSIAIASLGVISPDFIPCATLFLSPLRFLSSLYCAKLKTKFFIFIFCLWFLLV